ncbi:hypothetical protein OAD66_05115 [Bacteroidia bacterium]|nr:hypothetical protein [Bacteroidia bacterium]MDB9882495.1 hypothetical protein [Bacteroidia bacterium]
MNSRAVLVLLMFLVWSLVSGWYYVCKIKQACPIAQSENAEVNAINFEYNKSEPTLGTNFLDYKSDIVSRLDKLNLLGITGVYDENEVNITAFDNIGIARALAVQSLFEGIDQNRFEIKSRMANLDSTDKYIDGVEFKVIMKNEFIEETENGAFVFGDIGDVLDPKLDAYLTYIAIEYKDKMIDLVGHSYDEDTPGDNFNKALVNAQALRDAFISKGIKGSMLNASSKGQTEPRDNKKEENRINILINQ